MQSLVKGEVIVSGARIQYYERRLGSGPVLLFLHGWRSDGLVWNKLAGLLPRDYNVFALDLPGFGYSDAPPQSADLSYYVQTVVSFVEKLSLKNVVIIGHSFGGRVAIKLAAERPEWLAGLVLANAAGKENRSFGKGLKILIAKIVKPFFKPRFMQSLRRRIYESLGAEDYVATPKLKNVFLRVISEDLTDLLLAIRIPTLVISGEKDVAVPKKFTFDLRDKIPDADFFMLREAGHFSFLDEPQVFVLKVEDFLRERVFK